MNLKQQMSFHLDPLRAIKVIRTTNKKKLNFIQMYYRNYQFIRLVLTLELKQNQNLPITKCDETIYQKIR